MSFLTNLKIQNQVLQIENHFLSLGMENNNSVCYVARINEIKSIPGADNIEQAVVGGWNCIIKKGEYKVDDLVAIATTDAVIPQGLSDAMIS